MDFFLAVEMTYKWRLELHVRLFPTALAPRGIWAAIIMVAGTSPYWTTLRRDLCYVYAREIACGSVIPL